MYLVFDTEQECKNAIKEIDRRMGFNGKLTATFAIPRQDINSNYIIPKPTQKYIAEVELSSMFNYVIYETVQFSEIESEV